GIGRDGPRDGRVRPGGVERGQDHVGDQERGLPRGGGARVIVLGAAIAIAIVLWYFLAPLKGGRVRPVHDHMHMHDHESPGTPRKVELDVTGMTCAACQSRVQGALQKVPGVEDATVNLMMNNATVHYHPGAVAPAALVEAVEATGYGASLPDPGRSAFAAM